MKRAKTGNISFIAIITLFVVVNVVLGVLSQKNSDLPIPSSYSAHENGVKALFESLGKSGYGVKRLKRSYANLPQDAGAVMVMKPSYGVEDYELKKLREWLSGGGTLISDMDCTNGPLPDLGFEIPCSFPDSDKTLNVYNGTGLLTGIKKIGPGVGTGAENIPGETIPLIYENGRAVMSVTKYGKGLIIAAPFDKLFSNGNISKNDNAKLAYNIMMKIGNKRKLYFDEFHHGFLEGGERPAFTLRDALFGTAYGLFVLQMLLAGMVFFLNRDGLKNGGDESGSHLSASHLEFVDAGAFLYLRAGAYRESTGHLLRIFNRELNTTLGAHPDTSYEELSERFDPAGGLSSDLMKLAEYRDAVVSPAYFSASHSFGASEIIEKLRKELKQ